MRVRKATAADTPRLVEIAGAAWSGKDDYLTGQVANGCVCVAAERNEVTGFIVCNRDFFSRHFISLVAVALPFRRRGVATALFDAVEEALKGARLYTSTNESNEAMREFLKQRGYRAAGEIDLDPGDPELFFYTDL